MQKLQLRKRTFAGVAEGRWLLDRKGAEGQGTHLQQLNQEATCRCCLLLHVCGGVPHLAWAKLLLLRRVVFYGDCKCLQSLQTRSNFKFLHAQPAHCPGTQELWPGTTHIVACLVCNTQLCCELWTVLEQ